jgi:hypothetical protein
MRPAAPLSGAAISESLNILLAKLPTVSGELNDPHEFTGDMTVLRSITDLGDSAVARLVDCLDRTTPSAVTYKGRQVSVGLLCYVVLDRTAYYEAYDERPDDSHRYDAWPGSVTYSATPEQLRQAKRAWKDVVRRRVYHLT